MDLPLWHSICHSVMLSYSTAEGRAQMQWHPLYCVSESDGPQTRKHIPFCNNNVQWIVATGSLPNRVGLPEVRWRDTQRHCALRMVRKGMK